MAPSSRLARTARKVPTWVITRADVDAKRRVALERAEVEVLTAATAAEGHIDLGRPWRPLARAASRGFWWRAVASLPQRCCAPVWSTGWSGSRRRS